MEDTKNTGIENQEEQTGINEQGVDFETKDTFTKEEVEQMLEAETDRRVASAMKKVKKENNKALKEAQRLAAMNEEEQREFKMSQREAAVAEQEKHLAMQENKIEALKIMAEKGIPTTLVDFIVTEDADDTLDNIKVFESEIKKAVAAEVKNRLGSETPKAGNSTAALTKESFKKMSLAERTKLYETNKELYLQLSN